MEFKLVSDYAPMGDQPEAIAQLVSSIRQGSQHNVLLGVTGSGKTFTVANVIAELNRPTLVLSHNKTLAAQLYGEFKNFFPKNAVEYFVSYYDYYQPEAYLPTTDTYIEKDLSINADIEKMRLSAVATLLSGRRDVIVVSSVSCLYGAGNPADFHATAINIRVGQVINYKQFLYKLVEALYTRTERELEPATFRVNGDTVDIMAAFGEFGNQCFRVMFFDDEIEAIQTIDPATGQRIHTLDSLTLYPTSLFVTTKARIDAAVQQIYLDLGKQIEFFENEGRTMEAQRIKQRVEYDLEMIKELGYCPGIENYSRYFDGRAAGTRPFCLLDYFPQDYLMVVDESHVTIPQVHAMFGGDRARKENLVEYGFRLPAAKDNRPLTFSEFEQLQNTTIYVSATPADWELAKSEGVVVEQLIRPTGLVDPPLEVRVTLHQIDDLIEEIDKRVKNDDKVLVTTITKRMAEELSKYFDRVGVRNRYIHSDVDTLERIQILEDLRAGMFDVLIGVNLLREGLDLPEVALVAILDADKEGFLRNIRSITQIAGRAARHAQGNVILYGDTCTDSMRLAIEQSNRRREKQAHFNMEHGMLPRQAQKSGSGQSTLLAGRTAEQPPSQTLYPTAEEQMALAADVHAGYKASEQPSAEKPSSKSPSEGISTLSNLTPEEFDILIAKAREDMERAAKALDFLAAAKFRDRMYELQKMKQER
ncbi:MAG: excinuclease ABC subunit UvrB [Rikenellaceae bacterium]|nr:excinuclease ABC subunit UvrB [Rikenellaceae bacterium]